MQICSGGGGGEEEGGKTHFYYLDSHGGANWRIEWETNFPPIIWVPAYAKLTNNEHIF